MNPIFDRHFEELAGKFDEVTQLTLPSGAILICVTQVRLPEGWNRSSTSVRFIAPSGYPYSPPDCFWGDTGLALHNNLTPQASSEQPVAEINEPGTWFSWHVQQWNPSKDSLLTFFRVIEQRLQKPQ